MNVRPIARLSVCLSALLLASCGGTGGGSVPAGNAIRTLPMVQEQLVPLISSQTIYLSKGVATGVAYFPDTDTDIDTIKGGRGPVNGGFIDGIVCAPKMTENLYHVHPFIGILVNGREIATPEALGMHVPLEDDSRGIVEGANTAAGGCYYELHTHDDSGMVHIESARNNPVPKLNSSIYTLGTFLDVWGERITPGTGTSAGFGPFSGTLHVVYSYAKVPDVGPDGRALSGTLVPYTLYTGTNPRSIKLYSHAVVWIEVGTYVPPSGLPKISFYTEY